MANQHGGGGHQPFLQEKPIPFVKHGQGRTSMKALHFRTPALGKLIVACKWTAHPAPAKPSDRHIPAALQAALGTPGFSTCQPPALPHTPKPCLHHGVAGQNSFHGEFIPSFCAASAHCAAGDAIPEPAGSW